eukprot:gene21272-28193_t
MMMLVQIAATVLLLATAAPAIAQKGYPVTINNCGLKYTYTSTPSRVVTLHQGATEVMLALGLEEYMSATAYIDDAIHRRWRTAYRSINTTFRTIPSPQALEAIQPDFLYAAYRSGFTQSSLNYPEWLKDPFLSHKLSPPTNLYPSAFPGPPKGNCTLQYNGTRDSSCLRCFQQLLSCRPDLQSAEIGTFLQETYCEDAQLRVAGTLDVLYKELRNIADIFNVPSRAEQVIANISADFALVKTLLSQNKNIQPFKVLWLDSWDNDTPFVGACCGSPALIMQEAGMVNIAANVGLDTRATDVSEEVTGDDPRTMWSEKSLEVH